jgi:polysaccharide biosynthesis/export protein
MAGGDMFVTTALRAVGGVLMTLMVLGVAACGPSYAPAPTTVLRETIVTDGHYRIGPLDSLQILVHRAPEFAITLPVRPDGMIATPLIPELKAAGKTASELAREMEEQLKSFVQDPIVTIVVSEFIGPQDRQVRVIGEVGQPRGVVYRTDMTLLDLMYEVGGLSEFAAGNRAVLIRKVQGQGQSYAIRLTDLMRDGDVTANVPLLPGDFVIVPESWF